MTQLEVEFKEHHCDSFLPWLWLPRKSLEQYRGEKIASRSINFARLGPGVFMFIEKVKIIRISRCRVCSSFNHHLTHLFVFFRSACDPSVLRSLSPVIRGGGEKWALNLFLKNDFKLFDSAGFFSGNFCNIYCGANLIKSRSEVKCAHKNLFYFPLAR